MAIDDAAPHLSR